MEIAVTPEASSYIAEHGGTIYVRLHSRACCKNAVTLLDTSTSEPTEGVDSISRDIAGIRVELIGVESPPNLLEIELRGRFRPRPVAFWNGCAFKT